MDQSFVIIDSYNFLFRAFHATPKLTNANGLVINAVFGYIRMLLKYKAKFKDATFIVVADTGTKNFRHELYPQYKANRPPVDPDLIHQFVLSTEATRSLNVPYVALPGIEADDVIAALENKIHTKHPESKVVIVSTDKDLAQLVSDNTLMFDPVKDAFITTEDIIKKMSVTPDRVTDYLALIGDNADNIPGIRGIGPKTAAAILQAGNNIEEILKNKDYIAKTNPKIAKFIYSIDDNVILYKQLLTLKKDGINISDDTLKNDLTPAKFRSFLMRHQFNSILPKVDEIFGDTTVTTHTTTDMDANKLLKTIASDDGILFILYTAPDNITIADGKFNRASVNLELIRDTLINPAILKVTASVTNILKVFPELKCYHDILTMAYSATMTPENNFERLCARYGTTPDIHGLARLYPKIKQKMIAENVVYVYEKIDRPVINVLFKMQNHGIMTDTRILDNLSEEYTKEATRLEDKIYFLAGEPFNIGSPKQLGTILSQKLKIKLQKKSKKTGEYSTDVSVLEDLSLKGAHPIIDLILEWRHLTKMLNTYINNLGKHTDATNRIHTTYCLESTSTGRISSLNPNMQNIPIKSHEGKRIRKAFIASPGHKLISADYSQIELRILAHISQEDVLINQIIHGDDIHTLTAAQVFDIPVENVGQEMRRKAKSINFGIIYGISPFGLAKQLKITNPEASMLITAYLEKYPKIAAYIENTKKFAREHEYVLTIFDRRCRTAEINNSNYTLRQFAERAAVNAPLQGSAAEILKLAMIAVDRFLMKNNMRTKISLQIHDEIILESPEEEIGIIKSNIRDIMENVVKLSVPLSVNIGCGNNLFDL